MRTLIGIALAILPLLGLGIGQGSSTALRIKNPGAAAVESLPKAVVCHPTRSLENLPYVAELMKYGQVTLANVRRAHDQRHAVLAQRPLNVFICENVLCAPNWL
jgi:hypothetical protein